tara:strand:- start:37 stop:1461 length:1425 start_codon:yes stop_codon:yes gene_type:complete
MSDRERLQGAGDFILDGALIVGSSGLRVNVIDQISQINIYESIETPYITGSLLLSDSSGVAELLPLQGQERLLLKLRTPGHSSALDFNDYHAIIISVEKRFQTTDREQTFLLSWTTFEHYKNLRVKVSSSFSGTISSIVTRILREKKFLGTKKSLHIDETKNLRKYVIPNINPFKAIEMLRKEAVNTEGSPHFVFFENSEGYHFRSIDTLIGQQGKLNIPHKRTYKYEPPQAGGNPDKDPEITLNTILHWEAEDNNNSFFNARHGFFASTLYYHDIFNKNIQKFDYDYLKDRFSKRQLLSQENKDVGSLVSGAKIDDKIITEYSNSKVFVHPTASDQLHSEGTDNNAEEWLQEGRSRQLEQEYFTLKIEIYGDTDIKVGDVINVMIPSNKPMAGLSAKDAMDPLLSGRYLITQLAHNVHPTEQLHKMILTIMKDSVEKALPVKDLQIKEPPTGSIDLGLKNSKKTMKTKTKRIS